MGIVILCVIATSQAFDSGDKHVQITLLLGNVQ